ncbi:MAG: HEPN domain-containing protein [Candidatus Aquicultor sp.]|nr:HEPN domain-containing protein [Candidatus Aquicultor sp.]
MSKEFDECLKKRKITEFERAVSLVSKELDSAVSDLKSAKDSFDEKNYKWSIVQSYYSMFHSARTLIYSKGYRERSHYCLNIAIRELFVAEGKLSVTLVEALQLGKTLRENADYYSEFSEEAADQMIKNAQEFLETAKKLVK